MWLTTTRSKILKSSALCWIKYTLGLQLADTQTTQDERICLKHYAENKRSLVELGVMHGVNTALLRSVMHPEATVTGIDPHPCGRLGVSFERLIALKEIAKYPRGYAVFLREYSYEAARHWTKSIDFLFIDADHSWNGIDRDWRDWSGFIEPGGIVALHDSRSVPGRPDHDSIRYTQEIILEDCRFRKIDAVDSLSVLERL